MSPLARVSEGAAFSSARLLATKAPNSSSAEDFGAADFLKFPAFLGLPTGLSDAMGRPIAASCFARTPSLLGSLTLGAGTGGGFFAASSASFWAAAIFRMSEALPWSSPITLFSHSICLSMVLSPLVAAALPRCLGWANAFDDAAKPTVMAIT